MNRRDFCKHLALLSAGTAALPIQVDAFEKLYDLNSRALGEIGLLSVKDINAGFFGIPTNASFRVEFLEYSRTLLCIPMNFYGFFRYVTAPDCPMLATTKGFRWKITAADKNESAQQLMSCFEASVICIDQSGVIKTHQIRGESGIVLKS